MTLKRLGVVGTLVWDRIWSYEAAKTSSPPVEGWGGVAYSLAAVAAARPPGWEIVPLVKVGEDLAAEAHALLRTLPGLQLQDNVQAVPEPNNRVDLRYHDEARRCEQLTGGVPPWRWEELEPLVGGLDALYVNFLSGFEIELHEFQQLRSGFSGPIFADLHSLLLARLPDGRRQLRPLDTWREWVRCCDAVQLNEDELAALAGRSATDPWRFAADELAREVPLAVVTLGAEGVAYYVDPDLPTDPLRWPQYRRARDRCETELSSGRVALPVAPVSGDPTGCGDVWGGTFFSRLLAGEPLPQAIQSAHAAAARKVSHSGAAGLYAHLLQVRQAHLERGA